MELDRLFDEVYPSLFRYCNRLTGDPDVAEDVAQEAFVRAYRHGVTGELPGIRVWLFKVATHLVRDSVRVSENRRRLLESNPVLPGGVPAPDAEAERAETTARVREALEALNDRDRELLMMREEGFSYREMADAVGVAPGSVGTLLSRAQRRFADAYAGRGRRHGHGQVTRDGRGDEAS